MFKYSTASSNRYENKAKLKNNWKSIWELKWKMVKYKTIYHNRDYNIIIKKIEIRNLKFLLQFRDNSNLKLLIVIE